MEGQTGSWILMPVSKQAAQQTYSLSPFLMVCTNKQTRKPNTPIRVGQRDTGALFHCSQ